MKHDIAFGLAIFLIAWLSISGCSGLRKILGDDDPAPSGHYEPLVLDAGGSLLVSRGRCSYPDLDMLRRRANLAIENMRAAWPNRPNITVHSFPVWFSVNPWGQDNNGVLVKANGVYHPDGRWIELRCADATRSYEGTIEAELYHALGHKLGLWCWPTIGHPHGLDCST